MNFVTSNQKVNAISQDGVLQNPENYLALAISKWVLVRVLSEVFCL